MTPSNSLEEIAPLPSCKQRVLLGRAGLGWTTLAAKVIQYEEFVILVKLDIKKLVDLVKLIECLFKFSSLYLLWRKFPKMLLKYQITGRKTYLDSLTFYLFADILRKITQVHIISVSSWKNLNNWFLYEHQITELRLCFSLFPICKKNKTMVIVIFNILHSIKLKLPLIKIKITHEIFNIPLLSPWIYFIPSCLSHMVFN